jgi:16S rRNA (guanine966-N2)-methyltransferase
MRPSNRVRIIGGRDRGRVIRFPDAEGLRPTPDRVRETLFNWLGQDLTGFACLDLYAGTGVLTLEAASRGARLLVAVDRNRRLVEALRRAAETIGASGVEAHADDARDFLAHEAREFDVVFLDPPYASDPWDWLLPACRRRLSARGRIYAEADHFLAAPEGMSTLRCDRAGQVHYHLFAPGVPG